MKTTIVAVLAVLLMLTACDPKQRDSEKPQAAAVKQPDAMARKSILGPDVNVEDCWTVFEIEAGGNPHTQVTDEFCTEKVGSTFVLTPGANMDDWSPCAGETVIELHHLGGVVYRFCANVDPHDNKHPNDHTNFQIIFSPVKPDGVQQNMIIGVGPGVAGSSLHGGTAHSQN
jgi:hypothetical protein